MYLFILTTLYRSGCQQLAHSLADAWASLDGERYGAAWEFQNIQTDRPLCVWCRWSIPADDPHEECEGANLWHATVDYMRTLCEHPDCWEEATVYEYCAKHYGEALDEETDRLIAQHFEERDDFSDFDEEECPGGCGQPSNCCVCPELASLRRYNATPLEERCGPWTA